MKNKIVKNFLIIVLVLVAVYIGHSIYTINSNKILVTNTTDIEFDEMVIVFDGEKNTVPVQSGEKIDIPERFEAGIYLRLTLKGEEKEYIVKGYYGTYEMEYIKVKIIDADNTKSLSGVDIEVSE